MPILAPREAPPNAGPSSSNAWSQRRATGHASQAIDVPAYSTVMVNVSILVTPPGVAHSSPILA